MKKIVICLGFSVLLSGCPLTHLTQHSTGDDSLDSSTHIAQPDQVNVEKSKLSPAAQSTGGGGGTDAPKRTGGGGTDTPGYTQEDD